MANKALATRQKMQFRVEPSQKPRNPVAAAAKQRSAGPHAKPVSARRQAEKRALAKLPLKGNPED
ncbi:hypothetical protein [Janthinobacterium agaricidamnosum]|uniref:Uncharacterized protein n=1 Tax=Janthinobacterium agaricidamnosum NBRC 102515 = DSM 9628 TaxID=1349767 RepID=W0VE19_9BURK|nr:hypothetical protein [Janthinobacterium agaricidamnosum]CDG85648.1 putative uncharacterized protein [Janthinobacterium agaricidamnosum NBRC 102515 = DSM 9628]